MLTKSPCTYVYICLGNQSVNILWCCTEVLSYPSHLCTYLLLYRQNIEWKFQILIVILVAVWRRIIDDVLTLQSSVRYESLDFNSRLIKFINYACVVPQWNVLLAKFVFRKCTNISFNTDEFCLSQYWKNNNGDIVSVFRFYWFINVGSVIAFSGVAYVQQQKGFSVGFLIPLCSMFIALLIFVVARKEYIHKPSKGMTSTYLRKMLLSSVVASVLYLF